LSADYPRRSFKILATIELSDQFNIENRGDRYGIPGEDLSMRSLIDADFPTGRNQVIMANAGRFRIARKAIRDRVDPFLFRMIPRTHFTALSAVGSLQCPAQTRVPAVLRQT
jgi:hypothetical protein